MAETISTRIARWAQSRHGPLALFFASIAESTLVPVPIEMVMAPLMLADRARIWLYAGATLAGCVAGSTLAYLTGLFFFETAGEALIDMLGQQGAYARFRDFAARYGGWATAFIAITPIPLVTAGLGAGAAKMNFALFIAIVTAMRFVRYFGIGALVAVFGEAFVRVVRERLESRRARRIAWAVTLAALAGLAAWVFL
ncbi:DedA family protein [Marinicauda algicola]|uniref:DedA family protein n=1 Tax=Marinicauda algicola TaxID=2029849 RepID=A0A4S2H2D4_9PROT|nr:DedA family protein [Marinicauda algicola]TGY89760.1 DedA family protein [Marinicauda algicola]